VLIEPPLPRCFTGRAFCLLALPMIISRAGLAAMGIADGIMVARFESHEFAWLSLAEGTLGRLLDIFIAFLIAGLTLVPRHFAQGDALGARFVWLRTLPVSIGLGAAGLIVGLFGNSLLAMMGQGPELAAGAGPVMAILGAGYPAALLAISAAVYLEGMNRPHLVAASVAAANLLNVILNWVLIGGHLGLPVMGARGSAFSTTIVRCVLCLELTGIAWKLRRAQPLAPTDAETAERAASQRAQWRLGFGAAGTVAAMVSLGASLTLFSGRLGILSLATFSAVWNLAAPGALMGLGMADAAGICVAAEAGRRGEQSVAYVARTSLLMTLVPVGAIVFGLVVQAKAVATFYTNDVDLREPMAAVIPIVAFILLADCTGFVMAASLRAIHEAAWPAGIEIGSMLLLVPLAASLAFWRGYGVRGLFLAMFAAGIVRAAMLAYRFWWCTRCTTLHRSVSASDWSFHAE
jgi:MATE family multidrug resistance protein